MMAEESKANGQGGGPSEADALAEEAKRPRITVTFNGPGAAGANFNFQNGVEPSMVASAAHFLDEYARQHTRATIARNAQAQQRVVVPAGALR